MGIGKEKLDFYKWECEKGEYILDMVVGKFMESKKMFKNVQFD